MTRQIDRHQGEDQGRSLGATVARALDSAATAADERRREETASRARLVTLALAEGPAFLERVYAEATSIAQGFNTELGDARLAVRASDHIVTVADARWSGYVAVTAMLPQSADGPDEPYVMVSTRQRGSGGQLPWDFVDEGGVLMVCRGHNKPMSAEAFTRAIVGPWLECLPLPLVLVASIPSALPRLPRVESL